MKKLLLILLIFAGVLFVAVEVVTSSISETVTKDDLPQTVYEEDNPYTLAHLTLRDMFNPLNEEDEYSQIETFMNYMIYDSIKKNLNESYDPLSDCETEECQHIKTTNYMYVDYAFATLNDDNQIIVTVSMKRDSYPKVDTAVHLIFDVDINQLEFSVTLTLDEIKLADRVISRAMLDRIMNYADKDAIEESITYGELDLDEYTFTVTLITLTE